MATYTPEQLERYFKHIQIKAPTYDATHSVNDRLQHLTLLQHRHLSAVPFDNIALHYSPTRTLSLDPEDLFQKIIINRRGGYCMEVNTLFATVLRSLGYTVINVGGRVNHKKWSHMVNIVTIGDEKYLVDVGFGAREPTHPVPLKDGHEFSGILSTSGRLQLKHLEKHSATAKADPAQRLWVYSIRRNPHAGWEEMYSFSETEYFPEDFEMMSYFVSTRPDSWFVQEVVAYRLLMDETEEQLIGEIILHRDVLKIRLIGKEETVAKLRNEQDRIRALGEHFDIKLTRREQQAISGLVSEIKERD